ncbi:MAG: HAMP domain-containing protein [Burkholderiaceae bacterium]|nr:HAMP domain-containing protein [Sulfuritalea sp.]MCF8175571.1 HAMP domain-containing protein [Burkholderiaceae bacterium]MCF8184698.1 HAMP domain-containing protein [Polynucleobacter sp.]
MITNLPSRGLARRIYLAFLLAAVIPTAVAGAIGVYFSLETLRQETLRHLQQEVVVRAQGMARFFDQLAAELLYLADAPALGDLRGALAKGDAGAIRSATGRIERDYATLAGTYPHIYQIRYLAADGREVVRVDKKDDRVAIVPAAQLQNKAERYYFLDAMRVRPGELSVSPLDLNVEFGRVELPERPVIRVATPIGNSAGSNEGVLIINLHAGFLLEQVQQMAQLREGTAYLFDRSGHFVARTAGESAGFSMQPVAKLAARLGADTLRELLSAEDGTVSVADSIFAHATIRFGAAYPSAERSQWVMAVGFPEQQLFLALFNLYALYAILTISLLATAIGGYALSRHLLGPLEALSRETEAITKGDFSRRIEVRGRDEIAGLGDKFNLMAERIQQLVGSLAAHRDRLEDEVRERTAQLEHEQDERRELDRQMFQMDKLATLGELAMAVAHEIGNPLAGMKAVAQALQFEEDLPLEVLESLRRLESEVDRLTDFLRSFHGFAAPSALNMKAASLADALRDVLFWTRKEAKSTGITIETNIPADLPPLAADPAQLKQVLLNLVVNALHAMPGSGQLSITASVEGGRIRIDVRDSGCGIAADVLPRIFDAFFTTRAGGSGLGLPITAKIVRAHNAELEVESQAGHGTCMTLLWPVYS